MTTKKDLAELVAFADMVIDLSVNTPDDYELGGAIRSFVDLQMRRDIYPRVKAGEYTDKFGEENEILQNLKNNK
jgi:hypothetical protein